MKNRLFFSSVFLFGLCLIAFLGTSHSGAQEAEVEGIKVLSIPGPAFEMPGNLVAYTNYGVLSLNAGSEYVRAPLILPNNTSIKKVKLVCKDNSAAGDIRMWIHVFSNNMAESFTLCELSSTGAEDSYRVFVTTAISPRKLNTDKYNYILNVHLPGTGSDGFEIVAAKIYYAGGW